MDTIHLNTIRRNLSQLIDCTMSLDNLMTKLVEQAALSFEDMEFIRRCATSSERTREFYMTIIRKDGCIFDKLLECLKATENNLVYNILKHGHENRSSSRMNDDDSKRIWFQVDRPMSTFYGREESLKKVKQLVGKSSRCNEPTKSLSSQVTVISGITGIGKSELARQFVIKNYFHDLEYNVLWMNGNQLLESFYILWKQELEQFSDSTGHVSYSMDVVARVYKHLASKRTLFIFDNAECLDPSRRNGVQKFLPQNRDSVGIAPYILITSRNSDWEGLTVHRLSPLDKNTAVLLIQGGFDCCNEHRSTNINDSNPDNRHLDELVGKLNEIPFLLQLAVSQLRYIAKASEFSFNPVCPVEKFLKWINENNDEFFTHKLRLDLLLSNQRAKSFICWGTSLMDNLEPKDVLLAHSLMDRISYFHDYPIPCQLLVEPPHLDQRRLSYILEILVKNSILQVGEANPSTAEHKGTITCYPIIKKYYRYACSESTGYTVVKVMHQLHSFISCGDTETRKRNLDFALKHVHSICGKYIAQINTREPNNDVGKNQFKKLITDLHDQGLAAGVPEAELKLLKQLENDFDEKIGIDLGAAAPSPAAPFRRDSATPPRTYNLAQTADKSLGLTRRRRQDGSIDASLPPTKTTRRMI